MRPDTSWQRRFDDPIPLPGGGQFVTLQDAAEYILASPAMTSAQEHWQLAMQMLIDAADRGGIVMLAHIAVLRALNHGRPDPANTPRSPAEWLAEGHVTCSIQCLNGDRKH